MQNHLRNNISSIREMLFRKRCGTQYKLIAIFILIATVCIIIYSEFIYAVILFLIFYVIIIHHLITLIITYTSLRFKHLFQVRSP